MPRFVPQFLNFTSGQLSPRVHGRVDIGRYYNGAKRIEEFLILQQGGVTKVPGSVFVASTKTNGVARIIPFEFNTEQAYIVELGDQYIRFYREGGQIELSGSPYEVASPYVEADLFDLQFAQSADVMWIVHPSYKPRKLSRTGHTSWTLTNYAPTADPFTSTDNYPSCVTFFGQRIVFAATNTAPAKLFFSQSADYEDMTTGALDDDGFTVVLASGRVNRVRWIHGASQLIIGTAGDEYIETTSENEPLTPTGVGVLPQTNFGSASIQPVSAQNRTLFVQRSGKRIREFTFVFADDAFAAPDLTILAEHLFGHTDGGFGSNSASKAIVQLAYMREPIPVMFAVTADGKLHALTYEREQEVVGWSTLFVSDDENVESVAVIPGTGGDEVWVLVNRTINGGTKRYVEYLHTGWSIVEDAFYVHSGLTYDGSAATVITGLDHLEGEEVAILADGAVQPSKTVASGQITLESAASKVHAGLAYTATLEVLPLAAQGQSLLGNIISWGDVRVHLHNTVGILINGNRITFRTAADEMGEPVPLFSGVKATELLTLGNDQEATLIIESDQPLPCTVLGVRGIAEVSDE